MLGFGKNLGSCALCLNGCLIHLFYVRHLVIRQGLMAEDNTKTRILQSAGPIFAVKGYKDSTVRDICEAAGVNLAAVNYYFGDKQQLYIETVKLARQMRAAEAPMPEWSNETPSETKLSDFIRTMTTRMVGLDHAPWQVRLMVREVLQPTAACEGLVREYFRPHFDLLLSILDEILPADTPLPTRHQIGFSIIGQCVHFRVAGQVVALMVGENELTQHYSVDQLAQHVTRFSLAALGLSKPLGSNVGTKQNETGITG